FDRVTSTRRASGSGVTASTTLLTTFLVPLTTLCPTSLAVSAVSSATSFAFSTGPSAQTTPTERATARIVERESFIVLKISYSACQLAAPEPQHWRSLALILSAALHHAAGVFARNDKRAIGFRKRFRRQ